MGLTPHAIHASTIAMAITLGGCQDAAPPASPQAAAPLAPPPPAFLAGCADVRPGPVCVRPTAPVRIWVEALAENVQSDPPAERVTADTGTRLTADGAAPLTIRVTGHHDIVVRFDRQAPGPGRALHAAGKQANRDGKTAAAIEQLTAAATRQAADGDRSGAAVSAQILAFIHRERSALADARDALTRWAPRRADGAATATHAFFRGLIAYAGANPREALRAFDEAARWTARLALPLDGVIRQQQAATYTDLGRIDDALKALADAEARAADLPACARADLLTNLGWVLLASPDGRSPRTGAVLAGAESAYGECTSASATKRANAYVNLALWTIRSGAVPPVRVLGDGAIDPEVRAWGHYVRAVVEQPAVRAAALTAVADRAADAGFSRLQWRALVDAGIASEAVGDRATAITRFRAAEAVVAAGAFAIPADAGRSAFTADRRESANRLVAALVADGRPADAMDAARRARRRLLTSLPPAVAVDQLDPARRGQWETAWAAWRTARAALAKAAASDWELTGPALANARRKRVAQRRTVQRLLDAALSTLARRADAADAPLAPPAADEALLIWSARPTGGWTVFLRDAAGTIATDVTPPGWTAPIRDRLANARRVRVLAAGPIIDARLDLAGRPAVYALDLPPRPARPTPKTAALVADPTGDLPGAREEAKQVRPGLAAVVADPQLVRGAAATVPAMVAVLETVDHLHYAGHGRYAGFEGWESALPVRDGALELGDLLALRRVPTTVVLSGCETGRSAGEQAIGVGLAHAFLLRGAQTVIAPIRPVDDGRATRFGVALYAARARGDAWPIALQAGVRAAGEDPYRLFVP